MTEDSKIWPPVTADQVQDSSGDTVTGDEIVPVVQRDPDNLKIGFKDASLSTISFVDGTRTFTINHSALDDIFVNGSPSTKAIGAETVVITDTQGLWYFYYDTSFVLSASQTPFLFTGVQAFVALVYWDATANNSYNSLSDERHGGIMSGSTHKRFHDINGLKVEPGGLVATPLAPIPSSGANDTSAQITVTDGEIHDEDLEHIIVNAVAPANPFEQILSPVAEIPVWSYLGAAALNRWIKTAATTFPMLTAGTGRVAYNQNNAGTWQQTEVANGDYANYWLCYTPRLTEPVFMIQGQTDHASLSAAEAETLSSLTTTGLPVAEIVSAYRITFRTSNGFANTVKSRIEELAFLSESVPGGTVPPGTTHNSLSDRNAPVAHDYSGFRAALRVLTTPGGAQTTADYSVYLDGSGGVVDYALLPAADNPGERLEILATDISNACTVTPDGTDEIRGAGVGPFTNGAPWAAAAQYATITIESDGANWYIKNG